MSRTKFRGFIAVVALLVMSTSASAGAKAVAPAAAAGPTTALVMISSPGDYIGAGARYAFTPADGTFGFSGTPSDVSLYFQTPDLSQWWGVELEAPVGTSLSPGTYYNAERAPFRTGRAPGLDVYGDGRGCNNDYGTFAINQIGFDPSGNLDLLDASFVQHCESKTAPALRGVVLFNARPLSFQLKGQRGDYIAGGVNRTYLNSTSTFQVYGNTNAVHLSVSGLGDDWSVDLAAPAGEALQVGVYANATRYPFEATGQPGVAVYGDGRGCNNDYGAFVIKAIRFDPSGNVIELSAVLVQHCESPTAPALTAVIHYYA
jgi:hypothetical protein